MTPPPIRTLLVDNYDSYTYNLFQQLAVINGREPIVVTNDGATLEQLLALDIDNIVISAGPGKPENPDDFHVCLDLLRTATIPVLGVCLGHQGIAVAAGGSTVPASVVMHGRLSRVRHRSSLFEGIEQDFEVVRYHSLRVPEPLPDGLVPTAWADDGTLMALEETRRPVYGVQFHPESILTRHGDQIMINFRDLTRTWWTGRARIPRSAPGHRADPPGPAFVTNADDPGRRTPAVDREELDLLTAEVAGPVDVELAFAAVRGKGPAVWLDSAAEGVGTGRFSYLATGEGALAETVTFDAAAKRLTIVRGNRTTVLPGAGVFEYLARQLQSRSLPRRAGQPFDFVGGYTGWLGYEARSEVGSAGAHVAATPDIAMLFADRVIAIDHLTGTLHLLALTRTDDTTDAHRWLAQTQANLSRLRGQTSADPEPADPARARAARPDRTRDQYVADIERCRDYLAAGESYEICLTNQFRTVIDDAPFDIYRRLRRLNPAPYGAYLAFGDVEVCSSSPECFIRIDADRSVRVKPIKGTARRSSDPVCDLKIRDELQRSEKERAENLMIVDLLRNDLGKVCGVGTVRVSSLMAIESFETVHQMVSTISGRLRPDRTVADALTAVFPGGSMTGAPKIRTMDIIDRLETSARGVYSGGIGYFSVDGTAELSIVIRTIVCHGQNASVGAGGAITILSDPHAEWQEIVLKANAALGAINAYVPEAEF